MAASCAAAASLTHQEFSEALWAAFQNSEDCGRGKKVDPTVWGTLMNPSLTGSQETQHCLPCVCFFPGLSSPLGLHL